MTIVALTMLLLVTTLPSPSKLKANTLTTLIHNSIQVLVLIVLLMSKLFIVFTLASVKSCLRVRRRVIPMITTSFFLVNVVRRVSVELVLGS